MVVHNGPLMGMDIFDRKEVKLLSTVYTSNDISTGELFPNMWAYIYVKIYKSL